MDNESEVFCEMVFKYKKSEWWTCRELVGNLGWASLPAVVSRHSEYRSMLISLGAWLNHQKGKPSPNYVIENRSGGKVARRWRVVPDVLL